jgi:hypothetical protein
VGIWEIQDDRLFLRGLDGWTDLKKDVKLDMKTIFPERFEDGRVKADWFDGELTFLRRGFSSPEVERTKLPFAKGQVVAPATAQRVGMEARADTGPAAPEVDRDRRLYARRGEAQIPDIFILEGVVHYLPAEYSVKAFALESLWSDPKTRPRLLRFLEGGYPYRFSRGYRAIWEVHEGSLYLLALEGWIQGEKVHLRALLPDRFRNGRVKAEWFSGDLALISDEMLPLVARVRPQDPPQDAPKVKLEVKDGEVVSVEYEGKQREVGSRD